MKALTVVELRKKRMTQARIAAYLGLSTATVCRVLQRAGLSRLSDLDPVEPVYAMDMPMPATCFISIPSGWYVLMDYTAVA